MANLLDRNFQREILEYASRHYPSAAPLSGMHAVAPRELRVNIAYLDEHGLIHAVHPNANKRARHRGQSALPSGLTGLGGLPILAGPTRRPS